MEFLLRAKDVAKILNIRPSTVYDLAHRGILQHVRITQGTRRCLIRFRASDIEQLLRDRTVPSQSERPQHAGDRGRRAENVHVRSNR